MGLGGITGGGTTSTTNISGQVVKVSGETVLITGTLTASVSGQPVKTSGEIISVASGLFIEAGTSEFQVTPTVPEWRENASGAGVVVQSGIYLASGSYVQGAFSASVSGQPVGISGATLSVVTADYMTLIDDNTYSGRTYLGKAAAGASESSGIWQIKVIDETGAYAKILFADGVSTFTKTWDDRSGYTY